MQAILKTCSLRRHKESMLNGKRLLELPVKTTEIDELDFTQEERATYEAIETRAKVKFNSFLKKGTVMKNMACILTLLLRLRQLTCESNQKHIMSFANKVGHPYLIRRNPGDPMHPDDLLVSDDELFGETRPGFMSGTDDFSEVELAGKMFGQEFVDKVKRLLAERQTRLNLAVKTDDEEAQRDGECSICIDMLDDERICGPCAHSFCFACLDDLFNRPPIDVDLSDEQVKRGVRICPMCRSHIERSKTFRAAAFVEPELVDEDPIVRSEILELGGASQKSLGKRRAVRNLTPVSKSL